MPIHLLADLVLAEAQYNGLHDAWSQDPNDCDLEYRMEIAEGRLHDIKERIAAL